jgi:hypothetical protein
MTRSCAAGSPRPTSRHRLPDPEPALRALSHRGQQRGLPHRRGHRRPGARPEGRRPGRHRRHERADGVGVKDRQALRAAISAGLAEGSDKQAAWSKALLAQAAAEMTVPCRIGDYTDFYTGIHHATTIGKLFRPDQPLMPNYKWVPIGYHGRASSIGVSGQASSARRARPRRPMPRAELRPVEAARLRAGAGLSGGPRQCAGRADCHRRGRGPPVRRDAAQRLVGARPAGLGIPAARPVPGEELRQHAVAVDRDDRGAGAVPREVRAPRRRPAAAAVPRLGREPRRAARSTSRWRCCCRPRRCARPAMRPCA